MSPQVKGAGFPRSRKVRRHAEFQRIQSPASRSGRATSAHFVFLVAASVRGDGTAELARARLGLVVTKKVGNAVERNRVKRVCRECFRLWPDFVPPGVDLIVIARQGASALGLAEVREEWSRAQGALRHRVREVLAREASKPHVPARTAGPAPPPDTPADPHPRPREGRNPA
ncbi:MAG: ribonuclease P protein component [Polyangiaceae bacterium]